MPEMNMIKAINLALHQEMARDDSVVVLGEDVAQEGGVFRVTEGLLEKFGNRRCYDTPVSEIGIVGASVGMALYGLRPICEVQFSGFCHNAWHQINCQAARYRCRSRSQWTVPLTIRAPWGGGVRALEFHNEAEEALYVQSPGLRVVIPSGPRNARALLVSSIRDNDPVMFLEPKRVYRAIREEVPEEEEAFPLGQAQVLRTGKDVTLISYGAMLRETLDAAEQAEQELHITLDVIDLLSIVPMDTATIIDSVKKTGRCVIVHEAPRACGVAAEIIARINEQAIWSLEAPIVRVTGYDVPYPFFARENAYLPSVPRIMAAIKKTLEE